MCTGVPRRDPRFTWILRWLAAMVPVVGLGVLAAALPLWLFYFGGDLMAPTSPSIRDMLGLVAPAGLGGGVASYLAEHRVSFRRPRWWVATFGTAIAGALLTTVELPSG